MSARRTQWAALAILLLLPAANSATVEFKVRTLRRDIVELRLQGYRGNDTQREATLKGFFEAAGCTSGRLIEQPVKALKQPNLICTLPGITDSVILVGAHYDHVDAGDGVVDNWSAASLLPSFYQVLNSKQPQYTFVFAAFAGEEKGLIGSQYYVKSLPREKLSKIKAMICIDTLGLGPAVVWASRSDPKLVLALSTVAHGLNLRLAGVNVDRVGMSDEEAFIKHKVPSIIIHSVTQQTLSILHSPKDNYSALRLDDYFESYRLLSGYLDYLDQTLPTAEQSTPIAP